MLLFAVGLSVLTGALFGAAPALQGSSSRLIEELAAGSRSTATKGRMSLRSALAAGQMALSLLLLVGAGLLIRSFVQLAGTNPGFESPAPAHRRSAASRTRIYGAAPPHPVL